MTNTATDDWQPISPSVSNADDWQPITTSPQYTSDPIRTGYQSIMNNVASPINNTIGSTLGALTKIAEYGAPAIEVANAIPQSVKDKINDYWENKNFVTSPIYTAAKEGATQVGENLSDLESYNPDLAKDLSAFGQNANLAANIPALGSAAKGLNAVADIGAEDASRNIFSNNQGAGLPRQLPRSYSEVKAANEALSGNTSDAYAKTHELGAVVSPEASQAMAQTLQNDVGKLHPGLHPKTIGALSIFSDQADEGLNLEDIDNLRKQLGNIAYDSTAGKADIGAAKQGIKSIDNMLDGIQNNPSVLLGGTPEAVEAIKEARAASELEQNHDSIREIVRQSNGNPNALQSKFKSLFDDDDALRRYSLEQQQAIEMIAHPANLNKALETVGKIGFGGAGHTVPVFESGSAAAALALGNPITAAAIATPIAVGTAANAVRTRVVRNMVDNLLKDIESKSVPSGSSNLFKSIQQMKDSAGEMQPMQYGPMTPNQEYEAQMAASRPSGNTPFSKDVNAPMTSQLSPAERLQAAGNVYQRIANKPATPALDAAAQAKQVLNNLASGKPAATLPIKRMSDIAPSALSNLLAREQSAQLNEEAQSLLQQGYSMQQIEQLGYKHGGAIPSPAQIKAGNYKKDHIKVHGLDISIETPKGAIRRGKGWENISPADYGYIRKTEGGDGEHVDCYVGPNPKSNRIYIVDQHHLHNGKWDEHKVMIGFENKDQAISCYKAGFSDDKGKERIGKITRMSVVEFKDWLKKGDTKQPIKHAA